MVTPTAGWEKARSHIKQGMVMANPTYQYSADSTSYVDSVER